MYNSITPKPGTKCEKFVKSMEDGGVKLWESKRLWAQRPWDKLRYEKPWEVQEEP